MGDIAVRPRGHDDQDMADVQVGDPANEVHDRAARLLRGPVRLADVALAFAETTATTTEVHVGGADFFPPMLADIARGHVDRPHQPVRVPARARSASGSRPRCSRRRPRASQVRLVVDASGSARGRSGRAFFDRLRAGGIEVGVVRATRCARRRSSVTSTIASS